MKSIVLTVVFMFLLVPSFAQGMYGFEGGLGYSTGYKSYLTPTFGGYALHKLGYRVYAGADVSFQRYSVLNTLKTVGTANFGDIVSVRQRCSYAFISAKIDYAIGFHKYFHFNAAFGPGFFMGGKQYTNTNLPYWTAGGNPYGSDTTAVNTSYNIPAVIFKGTLGVSERIPTGRYWNVTLSQQFSFIPANLSKNGPPINTSYFAFQVGVMHKYPLVFVEY
jgi:hypothetical protein